MLVRVFGVLAVEAGESQIDSFPTSPCRDVLASVVLAAGAPIAKTLLVANVWPQVTAEESRNRLSVCLSLLRRVVPGFDSLMVVERQTVKLHRDVVNEWTDFWDAVGQFRNPSGLNKSGAARQVLCLHRAPLMMEVETDWAEVFRAEALRASQEVAQWWAEATGDELILRRAETGCFGGADLARAEGFEPPTPSSEDWCSIH